MIVFIYMYFENPGSP